MKHKYLLLLFLFILFTFTGCKFTHAEGTKVKAGVLDLSGWDFVKDGTIHLDGAWQFYWNKLALPEDDFSKNPLTGYYEVPNYWTNYKSLNLPVKGYATYRLLIKLDGKEHILSLSSPEIYSEYRLWVNGKLIDSNMSEADHSLKYLCPKIYDLYVKEKTLEVILQIKNERHINAGFSRSFLLGDSSTIHKNASINFSIDFLTAALCLFSSLYHILSFIMKRNSKPSLYFGLLCFVIFIRAILSHDTILMTVIPELPFSLGLKITTLTVPLGITFIILYTYSLYREEVPKLLLNLNLAIQLPYAFVTLICPDDRYFQVFKPYLVSVILTCICGIYVLFIIIKRKRDEYLYYTAGIVFLILGTLFEILTFINTINTHYYVSYSLAIFVIIQTLLISKRYTHAFRHVEILSSDLEQSIYKIENTQNAFLNAQIKPHFLYNTLNTIAQYCHTQPEEAEKLILYLSKYLRHSLSFENLNDTLPLRKEIELVSAYYYIEKARFDNINLEMDIDDTLLGCLIPPFILQPLIENAIKHGIRNNRTTGMVKLIVKNQGTSISFTISDNGSGIAPERLELLLSQPPISQSIGLYNIHTRLVRLYSKGLTIQSTVGEGTNVMFDIPLDRAASECSACISPDKP